MSTNTKSNICFLDTEFNATDYPDKNEGFQEIIEIGAVVFQEGKVIDTFSRYCNLSGSHTITKRCKSITGITNNILEEKGIPFIQAMNDFIDFTNRHNIKIIYAFGPADAIEMRRTAKLNHANKEIYNIINSIKNVYPIFKKNLELHYLFSLYDICRICNVDHDKENRAHNAIYDAEDTGKAFYNMRRNHINKTMLNELNTHKFNVNIYRNARNVKHENIRPISGLNSDFIEELELIFENAKSKVSEPVVQALHDDMMRIIGRPDLELGEEDL